MRDPRLPKEFSDALGPALTVSMHAAPFFGYMLMGTGTLIRHTTHPKVNVAATDGYYIYIAKNWVENYATPGQAFILLHEMVHIWFNHAGRGKGRDPKLWGKAIDLFTNTFTEHACVEFRLKTPEDGLQPNARYLGMTVEEIYDELKEDQEEEEREGGSGEGGGEEEVENDPLAGDVMPELREHSEKDGYDNKGKTKEMDKRAIQAATIASQEILKAIPVPGPVGDLINNRIADVLAPQIDWGNKLRQDLTDAVGDDYEVWEQPNPYYPMVVVPTSQGAKAKRIDYFTDVSGSMTKDWFNRVAAEIAPILDKCHEFWIHTFDAKIRSSVKIDNPSDLLNFEYPVGAHCSTHIEEILEFLKTTKTIAIVGTDGWFTCPDTNPGVNLRWVIPEECSTHKPWGEVHVLPKERY